MYTLSSYLRQVSQAELETLAHAVWDKCEGAIPLHLSLLPPSHPYENLQQACNRLAAVFAVVD